MRVCDGCDKASHDGLESLPRRGAALCAVVSDEEAASSRSDDGGRWLKMRLVASSSAANCLATGGRATIAKRLRMLMRKSKTASSEKTFCFCFFLELTRQSDGPVWSSSAGIFGSAEPTGGLTGGRTGGRRRCCGRRSDRGDVLTCRSDEG